MERLQYFEPGHSISTGGLRKIVKPIRTDIKLKFPGRIHVTPIDCNRFDFGKPGGGGIGFAVELENYMQISLADKDRQEAPADKSLLLAHITAVIKEVFGYDGRIKVQLHTCEQLREHKGFGSTTAIMTSCAQGINLLFDSPLTTEEIRRLIAYNFVEECNGKLAKAMETGVGTYVILKGGFVVVCDDLRVTYSNKFPNSYQVVLIDPGSTRPSHEEPENVPVFLKSQREDLAFRYQKAYIILMDLIPALYQEDIITIGDIIWRFQFSGTNLFLIQNYEDGGIQIMKIMTKLRAEGVPIVGLSSVGPTIYAITKNINSIHKVCKELNANFFVTRINNEGIKTQF